MSNNNQQRPAVPVRDRTLNRLVTLGKRLEGLGVTEEYGSRFYIEKQGPDLVEVSYMDDGQSNAASEGNLFKQKISLCFDQGKAVVRFETYPENEERLSKVFGDLSNFQPTDKSPIGWEKTLANWAFAISGNINIPRMVY